MKTSTSMPLKSSFVSSSSPAELQEMSTPTISNRAPPKQQVPPPLSLGGGAGFPASSQTTETSVTSSSTVTKRKPVFSSMTGKPLEVDRNLLYQKPSTMAVSTTRRPRQLEEEDDETGNNYSHRKEFPCLSTSVVGESLLSLNYRGRPDGQFFMNLALTLACDLLKAGAPIQVIRTKLHHLATKIDFRRSPSTRQLERQNLITSSLADQRKTGISSKSNRLKGSTGLTEIRGIPNYGQTCFLNSVLQALASLEPFLVYLERIIQLQDDLPLSSSADVNSSPSKEGGTTSTASCFSRQLLRILDAINGDYSTRRVDPRNLLKRIGETNSQFRSNYMEQQDAQEVLQAILSVIISDAQLDSTSSLDPCYRFHDDSNAYYCGNSGIDDETLTAVLAREAVSVDWGSPSSSVDGRMNGLPSLNGVVPLSGDNNAMTFSYMGEQIFLDIQQSQVENGGDLRKMPAEINPSSPDQQEEKKQDIQQSHVENGGDLRKMPAVINPSSPCQQEEKKDDMELYLPCSSSEDNLTSTHPKSIANGGRNNSDVVDETASFISDDSIGIDNASDNDSKEGKLSTSMQILKSTISSLTPSPLSGWLGSTLRCCNCKHVRPIQNAPFLDIPVVPRAVSDYLANTNGYTKSTAAPNASPMPPCSLNQCLQDFTSVERVSEVECQSCSIQNETTRLEEEVMLLQGAISTMEKRIKQKGGDPEETRCLKGELKQVEMRLLRLKTLDPDDEDSSNILLNFEGNTILEEDDDIMTDPKLKKDASLQRCNAKKCLLMTRCPSILCCHVQRRYWDPNTDRMEKCIQFVEFPPTLDLSPYCAYGPRASTPWAAGSEHPQKMNVNSLSSGGGGGGKMPYKLRAMIEHRGNAFSGHYVSYRTNHKGHWFRISDSNVTPIPWQQVRTCQAYMLFYEAI